MAKATQSSKRNIGLFGTHRGRSALTILLIGGVLAFAMLMLNGILNPSPRAEADAAAAASASGGAATPTDATVEEMTPEMIEAQKPEVQAAIYDPFALGQKGPQIKMEGNSRGGNAAAASASASEQDEKNDPLYTATAQVALGFARQYSTYSFEQTPQEYVNSLSPIRPELKDALSEAAEKGWPDVRRSQVKAGAGTGGAQPLVIEFDGAAGTATVSVSIQQEVSDRLGNRVYARSYLIDLMKNAAGDGWDVAAVRG